MSSDENSKDQQIAAILDKLRLMERRIGIVESEIGITAYYEGGDEERSVKAQPEGNLINSKNTGQGLESGFGEYGLAWIGNIVLLFGITFLMQYIQNKDDKK